jgi:Zn-dependent metalloprotease
MLFQVSHDYCTIIPPHMTEKVKEAGDDSLREAVRQASENHSRLRTSRAMLFSGERRPFDCKKAKNSVIKIYDAGQKMELPGERVQNPCDSSDSEARQAFIWAFKTHDFYKKLFNRDSINNQGMTIKSSVHYGKLYDNAFWDGKQMAYGDGDGKVFGSFTDPIDITGHEMTHGVTEYDINLKYLNQSGALNESFSDVFGSMIKQNHLDQTVVEADWQIGEGLVLGNEKWTLRSLKAPGTAYIDHPVLGTDPQPATMDAYKKMKSDNGGVHINSGIPNHAFYLFATKLYDIDSEKYARSWNGAGRIWYDSRFKISPKADFAEFANATIAVSDETFGKDSPETKAIRKAWAEVKIFNHKPPGDDLDCFLS